ncbi:hypothetical protein DQ04_00361000 [Trypanosoma grayi]|uniref:hypothetical protein n=1 Tax=Trypanosoma grayi TaxID=71804 RepID=UPI0004F49444|nr:hypothetical protein DQ04_00361000 [Trypanosoma grayi]KEG14638.1 hypothetical protein DQ04_00361000 [Trypanosoma grayi]
MLRSPTRTKARRSPLRQDIGTPPSLYWRCSELGGCPTTLPGWGSRFLLKPAMPTGLRGTGLAFYDAGVFSNDPPRYFNRVGQTRRTPPARGRIIYQCVRCPIPR